MPKVITIAKDFSKFPAGRYRSDGPYSGQRFREDYLVPALKNDQKVIVELDGALGYGSSFLEEAFGGLIREHHFPATLLERNLEIKSSKTNLIEEAWMYINDAGQS